MSPSYLSPFFTDHTTNRPKTTSHNPHKTSFKPLFNDGRETLEQSFIRAVTPSWADGVTGHEALAAAKIAASVSTKAASYMMEVANHAQKNAEELDKARRAIEKYVVGTDVDTVWDGPEPFLSGTKMPRTPQEYSTYEMPLASVSATKEGRKMFGADGGASHIPPYLQLDYAKSKGMWPTDVSSGSMGIGGMGGNSICLLIENCWSYFDLMIIVL